MIYKIIVNNRGYKYSSKYNLVKALMKTLAKKNPPETNRKQCNIVKYAKKGDILTLTYGNYSAKEMIKLAGGRIYDEK